MPHSPLSHAPALRILLPFILGLIASGQASDYRLIAALFIASAITSAALFSLHYNALRQFALRSWWYAPICLCAIALGMLAMRLWEPKQLDLADINGKYVTAKVERVDFYDFSVRLHARLRTVDTKVAPPQLVLLTTRGCDYALREGDILTFKCDLSPVVGMGNPDEYDRRERLWQQGICYSQHLPADRLHLIRNEPTLTARARTCQRRLAESVLKTSLPPHSQSLMLALLLGDSRTIDNAVRERFSQAGIAHILALSGLHVGLVCSLIWFMLFPLDYLRLKKLRLLLTLCALIAFCFVTGLSPSVIRATIMIGFTLIGIVLFRKSSPFNALCIAALVTLMIWPSAIFQAGFQLSYATVACMLLLQPLTASLPGRGVVRAILSISATSLIAMLATIMLCAYYFCTVSLLSVLSNLLILPLMPLLMLFGVIFLFLAAIGLEFEIINSAIEAIDGYMTSVSNAVAGLPASHITGVYVSGAMVCVFYGIVICVSLWLLWRNVHWLLMALAGALALALMLWHEQWQRPEHSLIILNDYSATPIMWSEDRRGYVWIPDNPSTDTLLFAQIHRRLLAHLGVDTIHWVEDSLNSTAAMIRPPLAFIHKQKVLAAGTGLSGKALESMDTTAVDYIVVTKRYHGQLSDLAAHFPCRLVILSGDLADDRRKMMVEECRRLSLPCRKAPFTQLK